MVKLHAEVIETRSSKIPMYCLHSTPFDHTYLSNSFHNFFDQKIIDRDIHFLDLPSHGRSEDLELEEISFKRISKVVDDYRRQLGHEKIIIYGHGIGGLIAQVYAINFKRNLGGLILSNTSGDPKYQQLMGWNIRDRMSKVTKQKIEAYYGKTDEESLKLRFSKGLVVYFDPPNEDLAMSILNNLNRFASEAYIKISHFEIPNHYMRENMRTIKCPTLIIGASKDVWPVEYTRLLRNDMIRATYVELPGGHFYMLEEPDSYWSEIINFLQSIKE